MTQREFDAWVDFYRQYPFDDLHRFHRPAALVSSSMGGRLQERLDWLAPQPIDPLLESFDDAARRTITALGVLPTMKGG